MPDPENGGKFEAVSPRDERLGREESDAARVEVEGIDDDELVRLLEDTAAFIRSRGRAASDEEAPLELMFRRVDLGDFVILAQRS